MAGMYNNREKSCLPLKTFIQNNLLVILIVTGALIGFIIGISINKSVQELEQPDRYTVVIIIGFPGELLIRMLKLLILPLISCSLIVGLTSLDTNVSGRIGARAVLYYMGTTCLAAVLGLILVSAIQPGSHMAQPDNAKPREPVRPLDSFLDIVRNMFPPNFIEACAFQHKTVIKLEKDKLTNRTYKIGDGLTTKEGANFLGVIVFSIAVGAVASSMGEGAQTFVKVVTELNNIVTKLVIIVMWYSPIGIMSLIMARFAEMRDIGGTFSSLGLFIVTVVVGIAIHGLVVLPLIYFAITRGNPYLLLKGCAEAMTTAFGTDSSAATLPVTLRCLEENLHIDRRITRFILPIGTTINMDGTALYEAVSAIFIAQSVGQSLSAGDYFAISFASILASVGAAAIPHAGLVTMLIVLDTVGLPTDMIAVIFSVDWFLDRVRTMINVLGDSYGAGIVQHLSRADLNEKPLLGDDTANTTTNLEIMTEKPEIHPVSISPAPDSGITEPIIVPETEKLISVSPVKSFPRKESLKGSTYSGGSETDLEPKSRKSSMSRKSSVSRLDRGYSTDGLDHGYSEKSLKSLYTTDYSETEDDGSAQFTTYL